MKCELCDQLMQMKPLHLSAGQNILHTQAQWVCINNRCPDYFEPAARHPENPASQAVEKVYESHTPLEIPPTEPARGHGIKLDAGKPLVYTEFLMQFPRAIRLIARVGEKGSQAPGHVRSGWKTVEHGYERYSDAFARHILKEVIMATEAEPVSPDPVHDLLWEAATVAWNDLARLEHLIRANQAAAERLDGDPLA